MKRIYAGIAALSILSTGAIASELDGKAIICTFDQAELDRNRILINFEGENAVERYTRVFDAHDVEYNIEYKASKNEVRFSSYSVSESQIFWCNVPQVPNTNGTCPGGDLQGLMVKVFASNYSGSWAVVDRSTLEI